MKNTQQLIGIVQRNLSSMVGVDQPYSAACVSATQNVLQALQNPAAFDGPAVAEITAAAKEAGDDAERHAENAVAEGDLAGESTAWWFAWLGWSAAESLQEGMEDECARSAAVAAGLKAEAALRATPGYVVDIDAEKAARDAAYAAEIAAQA